MASNAIARKTCSETGAAPVGDLCGQTWGSFGEGHAIGGALVVMAVRCVSADASADQNRTEPSQEALLSSGAASEEELRLLSPQSAEEIYNEFDFTGTTDRGLITLSYGEPVSEPNFDFEPVMQRAESFAEIYHAFLGDVGELTSTSVKIRYRDWFFASQKFATIHICFDR